MSEPRDGSRKQPSVKPGAQMPFGQQLARTSWLQTLAARRNDMHPEELMKPDLLSEFVLLTFGTLILASLVLFVTTTLARL
jgi:hypothetical protein